MHLTVEFFPIQIIGLNSLFSFSVVLVWRGDWQLENEGIDEMGDRGGMDVHHATEILWSSVWQFQY